jgi:hypothetical protein
MSIRAVQLRRHPVGWSWGVCSTARPLFCDSEDHAPAHMHMLGVLMSLLGGWKVKA